MMNSPPGPSQISRERMQRRITVEMNVRGRALSSFFEEVRATIERDGLGIPTIRAANRLDAARGRQRVSSSNPYGRT